MATTTPPFVLQRAMVADLKEIVALQYECFPDFVRKYLMGCESEADLHRIEELYRKEMEESPTDVWNVVRDVESGRIIAGSNWRIFQNRQAGIQHRDTPVPWLEGENRKKAQDAMDIMNGMRERIMPDGYVYLHICFTDPNFRRRAAGHLLMQWGCDIADALALPGYIEASKEGNFLYKTFGFEDRESIPWDDSDGEGMAMVREARLAGIAGGKPKPL